MGICSYLVIPETGQKESLVRSVASIPGCDVVPATNRDLFVVVTDTPAAQERSLRERIEAMSGVQAMVLTFAEVTAP
jgi:nitrate reductase NapAB chaperone NapD